MNENPEGTPNPLNPTPTPTPDVSTGANTAENDSPISEPAVSESSENIESVTAEQLVEPAVESVEPETPESAAPETPEPTTIADAAEAAEPETLSHVAPHPPMHSGRVMDPMMVHGRHNGPMNHSGIASTEEASSTMPSTMGADTTSANSDENADAIVEQLSQNTEQPAATEPVAAKPKKNKTGLIVAAIVFALIAIGCAVAAIVILKPFAKDDRVNVAIEKLLSGQMPSIIAVNGKISGSSDQVTSGVNALDIDLNAQFNTANKTNTASATVTAGFADDTELTFDAEELTTEKGDVFLRLNGVGSALQNMQSGLKVENVALEAPAENCIESEDGTTNCAPVEEVTEVVTTCEGEACDALQQESVTGFDMGMVTSMFNTIDGEWIRIPLQNTETGESSILDNPAQCLATTIAKLPNYGSDIKSIYDANPFIEYSTENLGIVARKDNLYRISINADVFTNFVNAMKGDEFANELLACVSGTATNDGVTTDEVNDMFESYPTMYVEVNDQYQFTRVVFDSALKNGATVNADLNLSYPSSITVTEPGEYLEINEVINRMVRDLYGISTDPTTPDDVLLIPTE